MIVKLENYFAIVSSSYEGGYANQTMNTLQVRNQRNDINMTVDDVDYGDTTSMTQNNK